jgi:hypothetical protein
MIATTTTTTTTTDGECVIIELKKLGKKLRSRTINLSARSAHVGYVLHSTVTLLV